MPGFQLVYVSQWGLGARSLNQCSHYRYFPRFFQHYPNTSLAAVTPEIYQHYSWRRNEPVEFDICHPLITTRNREIYIPPPHPQHTHTHTHQDSDKSIHIVMKFGYIFDAWSLRTKERPQIFYPRHWPRFITLPKPNPCVRDMIY